MRAYSIAGINNLPADEKREIFIHLIPDELFTRFSLPEGLYDPQGNNLLLIKGNPGERGLELRLYHQHGFQDPILYSHLIDTLNGQVHVLLYVMNDPDSPRFNIDRMPDGTKTMFATVSRNIEAELAAMQAGLLPGQIRSGLNILSKAVDAFENFIQALGHQMYFNEPLYYHNAIIFERYGFSYQSGRRQMEEIHRRFNEDQAVLGLLGTTPFRDPAARTSIFHRTWAIHDGILGERFEGVTMYKTLGKHSEINTAPGIGW
jgi:hypothetical protein